MPVIYIDVLFFVNLIINYILLRACCAFIQLKLKSIRVMLGAFIGACYAVLVFFPDFSVLYSTVCKLLVSMLIVAVSFPFFSLKNYIKALLVFYMISFGFGGCVLGVFYFSDIGARLGAVYSNGIFYFNLPWSVLALSGGLFYLCVKIFGFLSKRHSCSSSLKKKIYISYGENTAEITALLDTGNSLIDPVSLSPVIVAEYKSVKNLFKQEVRDRLDKMGKENIVWVEGAERLAASARG